MYWEDTAAHTIGAFDFELSTGTLRADRIFARFPAQVPGDALHR
jgi:hypothetical protein